MSWANRYIEQLANGQSVTFRPKGHSMTGIVNHNQLVTVSPLTLEPLSVGDVVLCKVKGAQYLHLVKAKQNGRVLIGNNKGRVNGWTSHTHIYGKLVKVHQE